MKTLIQKPKSFNRLHKLISDKQQFEKLIQSFEVAQHGITVEFSHTDTNYVQEFLGLVAKEIIHSNLFNQVHSCGIDSIDFHNGGKLVFTKGI